MAGGPLATDPESAKREGPCAAVVEAYESGTGCLDGATLVACRLETGRTHQIRIHLAEAGHPLLGERVYGREFAGRRIEAPRVMLHAEELGFAHPATGDPVRWSRRPPADLWVTRERLRR